MADNHATLTPAPRLAALIGACEKLCEAECCGVHAFDFSPVHVASHLSAYTGNIREADVVELRGELRDLMRAAEAIPDGWMIGVAGMNQYFKLEELRALAADVGRCLDLAPAVREHADQLWAKGTS